MSKEAYRLATSSAHSKLSSDLHILGTPGNEHREKAFNLLTGTAGSTLFHSKHDEGKEKEEAYEVVTGELKARLGERGLVDEKEEGLVGLVGGGLAGALLKGGQREEGEGEGEHEVRRTTFRREDESLTHSLL
jgi:hypothetical protein